MSCKQTHCVSAQCNAGETLTKHVAQVDDESIGDGLNSLELASLLVLDLQSTNYKMIS